MIWMRSDTGEDGFWVVHRREEKNDDIWFKFMQDLLVGFESWEVWSDVWLAIGHLERGKHHLGKWGE